MSPTGSQLSRPLARYIDKKAVLFVGVGRMLGPGP